MSREESGDFGAFLAGFVIGGLVGAAAALILAPQSGLETRHQLLQKGGDFRSRADEYRTDSQTRGLAYLHEMQEQVEHTAVAAQKQVTHVLDESKSHLENIGSRLSQLQSEGEKTADEGGDEDADADKKPEDAI